MLTVVTPDAAQVTRWLEQSNIQYYICDQCHGLHLSELQGREGVLDARLFVEEEGVLFSTELEIRPAAIFAVQAELTRLNMEFPSLKLFVDVDDESMPRLVACDLLLGRQGVTFDQFIFFVQVTLDATVQLLEDAQQANWLFPPDDDSTADPGALH